MEISQVHADLLAGSASRGAGPSEQRQLEGGPAVGTAARIRLGSDKSEAGEKSLYLFFLSLL